MLQFLPKSPERARVADLHPGDAPEGTAPHAVKEDEAWVEGRALVSTVEDLELIDPALSSERLVYRLFHEPGVRVFRASEIRAECSCSRDNVEAMLKSFSQDDRDHMVENGKISVTCEFCSATYVFAPGEVGAKVTFITERAKRVSVMKVSPAKRTWSAIDRPLGVRRVERERRNFDIEMLAGRGHHAVAAGHEAGRRRQRHAAGVFERLARLEHRLFADHARAFDLLEPPERVGDAPVPGLELYRLSPQIGDVDGIGPEEIAVGRRGSLRQKAGRDGDLDLAGNGAVHRKARSKSVAVGSIQPVMQANRPRCTAT